VKEQQDKVNNTPLPDDKLSENGDAVTYTSIKAFNCRLSVLTFNKVIVNAEADEIDFNAHDKNKNLYTTSEFAEHCVGISRAGDRQFLVTDFFNFNNSTFAAQVRFEIIRSSSPLNYFYQYRTQLYNRQGDQVFPIGSEINYWIGGKTYSPVSWEGWINQGPDKYLLMCEPVKACVK